jgi:soluble P-type ATPase
MFELTIPGYKKLLLSYIVLDYNGTVSCDGRLITGVKDLLEELSQSFAIHILTADTYGNVQKELSGVPCEVVVIGKGDEARAKTDYLRQLEAQKTVCVGNGRNDALMLKEAALGIAVIQEEGCAVETLLAADIVTRNILDALDLLRHPLRLTATLRS